MSKIYTKTGDKGKTSLFNGVRTSKYSLRVSSYGTIDELASIIGIATCFVPDGSPLEADLKQLSNILFKLTTDLASPFDPPPAFEIERINQQHIYDIELLIDKYINILPKMNSFIIAGGSKGASFLHQARTVARRAERLIVELAEKEDLGEFAPTYVNRLSDYLFVAARYCNFLEGVEDIPAK